MVRCEPDYLKDLLSFVSFKAPVSKDGNVLNGTVSLTEPATKEMAKLGYVFCTPR